jgi:hypothetical protein
VDRWVSHLDRTARRLVPGGRPLLAWGRGKFHTAQRGNAARRWELCSMRCGSVSPSSWWTRRTLPSTRTRRRRSCTRSGAMSRARLSGASCGTKTPLTLSGAASSAVTRMRCSISTACWFVGSPTAPATFSGYLAEPRCKWWSGSASCGDGECHGRCCGAAAAPQPLQSSDLLERDLAAVRGPDQCLALPVRRQ